MMMLHSTGRRLRLTAVAAALLLSLTACGTAASAPVPPTTSASPTAAPTPAQSEPQPEPQPEAAAPAAESEPASPSMPASRPVQVTIPALERVADLVVTGMRADRRLEVPPEPEGSPASWYDGSPTPGERGAAVLLGHVNSPIDDSGVFYGLETMQAGDLVEVAREDGSVAVFETYRVESFAKDAFPTRAVYYPVPGAELRLITCDSFDDNPDEFPNNLVVFAKLVEVR
ncbi:sortase domain-bontaining protein [Agrococcus beijingensis]|uniref:sortase domain-containing protein n=1 Tax=Agrococcus beijingensis TaxID=3068634 RepID=UPI0027408798|nr:sortase [Agrococcus sp. REN33]